MNIPLLRLRDEQECNECFDELWTIALNTAANQLYIPPYTEEDRRDVAQKVLVSLLKWPPPPAGIDYCDDDNPESCRRWVRMRSWSRAVDLRRQRRRARKVIIETQNDDGNVTEQEARAQRGPIRFSMEGLVDELVAAARLMHGGFSIREEAILREILIKEKLQREFAQEYDMEIGTVGRLVTQVKRKISKLLGGEFGLF